MTDDTLKIPVVESLKAELEKRREKFLSDKTGAYPRKNPILSDIGDCDRQIAYGVTNWKDKPLPSPDLQARFEAGKDAERIMARDLLDLGFDFMGAQDSVTVTGRGGILLATGKIDGFIKWQGEKIPGEFKSLHPNVYDSVDSVEGFSKKPWLRKYIRQLQMYMFGNSKEYGLFGLTNCLGAKKWFVLYLDLGECELILRRLEAVQKHLSDGTLPDRIPYKDDVCGKCSFANICLADIVRSEAEILTDDSLIASLEERESLKDKSSRYNELDKAVKKALKGIPKGIAGGFMILGKPFHRDAYSVESIEGWTTSIKKLS